MEFKEKHFKRLWKKSKPSQSAINYMSVSELENFAKMFYYCGVLDVTEQINKFNKGKPNADQK